MRWKALLERWKLNSLKLNLQFLEAEFTPSKQDKNAAWQLYIELITRVTTQALPADSGDEKRALTSVYELFDLTRGIIKDSGPECIEFAKIAVVVLNQVVRPFTAKWHKESLAGAFNDAAKCKAFRQELEALQQQLSDYAGMLSELAGVEDLRNFEI